MIYCKKCGHEDIYSGRSCAACGAPIRLDQSELRTYQAELREAKKKSEWETVLENCHILADQNITEAQREYAIILEGGRLAPRNLDLAAEYYGMAAKKFDPYSAYKYSRLLINGELSKLWLTFSALLGCNSAYLEVSKYYESIGKEKLAVYYLYLAAIGDDVDAIVAIAQRYYDGRGIEKSEGYAKWYLEKLSIPPFNALKLAYKIRGVKASEPPEIRFPDRTELCTYLLGISQKLSEEPISFYLTRLLCDSGETKYMLPLAKRYLDGLGTERNVEEAQRILSHAASIGDAEAYIMLGDILLADPDRDERALHQAIECYERSAKHGNPRAFEILADLYHSKDFPERNVAYAYELYVLAAEAGISTAAEKARSIRTSREEYFENARRLIKTDPATAFRYLVIADAMGHEEAALTLGGCFEIGLGTKKNRRAAFEYYEKAAKNKVKGAHFRLGRCYAHGIGTAFSFDLAVRHLKIADRQSDKRAHGELEALLLKKKKSLVNKLYSTAMRLIYKKKFSEALKLLSAASDEGHARASYALGCLYEFGKGTKQNRRYASELYAKAEALEAPRAREHYKITILRMIK